MHLQTVGYYKRLFNKYEAPQSQGVLALENGEQFAIEFRAPGGLACSANGVALAAECRRPLTDRAAQQRPKRRRHKHCREDKGRLKLRRRRRRRDGRLRDDQGKNDHAVVEEVRR